MVFNLMDEYRVVLQNLALKDLDEAYEYAAQYSPGTAIAWLNRFQKALETLATNPQRCPEAPENRKTKREIREFLFGKRPNVFRAIYTIDDNMVRILRIRRASRRFLTRSEVDDALDS